MGSGKSVVGALVAQRTKAPFHDLDLMVEREAGMPIPEIFAAAGEPRFRELEAHALPGALEPGAVVALVMREKTRGGLDVAQSVEPNVGVQTGLHDNRTS